MRHRPYRSLNPTLETPDPVPRLDRL